jgi:hypothetical protein
MEGSTLTTPKVALPTLDELLGKDRSTHEPSVPSLVKQSVFFVKSLGMRQVPELLIIELFRELCFKSPRPANENKARELLPTPDLPPAEVALLYAARGRSKRTKDLQKPKTYFGPLYPLLARNAWARVEAERVIASQFVERPLSQYLAESEEDATKVATTIISALYGRKREEDGINDIFSEILAKVDIEESVNDLYDPPAAAEQLADRLKNSFEGKISFSESDGLASTIGVDFINLCRIEGQVPRLMWMDLLKSFLRLAMPSWLLAHMKMTVYLRDWTLTALAGTVTDDASLAYAIQNRWQGIYHPTKTGSNEVLLHLEGYVKARVELSLLVYLVRHALGPAAIVGELTSTAKGHDKIPIADWLILCREAGGKLNLPSTPAEVRAQIVPYAQAFGAWLNPKEVGQGKNIFEFLRILLRLSRTDNDDGYLLTSTAKGGFDRAVLFPGSAMLKTVLMLAAARKRLMRGSGKLVLSDLERHFAEYGVDFATSAGARPQLIAELSRLGFLKGSPDAGDSAELVVPTYPN